MNVAVGHQGAGDRMPDCACVLLRVSNGDARDGVTGIVRRTVDPRLPLSLLLFPE